jgi:glyoxylase-like metal-dependent hydrolase (beta-lactamase superfamily II)
MPEILPGVHVVELQGGLAGPASLMNVCLLIDGGAITMVDAGLPGSAADVVSYLEQIGRRATDIRRIVITHHHVDHVGGLAEIVRLSGAEVWAHRDDADIIEGRISRPPIPKERVEAMLAGLPPEQRQAAAARAKQMNEVEAVAVDLRLCGGEELRLLGGLQILHSPGHTAGHLCLYSSALSLLIAGDLLRLVDGVIRPSPTGFAADAELALASAKSVAALPFECFVGYHGGYVVSGGADLLEDGLRAQPSSSP